MRGQHVRERRGVRIGTPAWRRRIAVALAGIALALAATIAIRGLVAGDRPAGLSGDFPPAGARGGEPAVVWAVGDGADGSSAARAVAARIANGPLDRLLYLGDVYEHGTAQDFRDNYQTTYGRLASVTAPTPGNHDAPNEASGYDPYWRRALGAEPPNWYTFRAGGWQIISLDSEGPHDGRSAQHRWLQRRLRAPGTCRLVFWHRARFSADTRHGDQQDMAALWDALRGRAAVVLAGHAHNMQRFRPIDGITQFVSGAGGDELYPLRRDARLAFGEDSTRGALRLRLRPGAAAYAFVAVDGRTLDSGTLRCQA